MFTSDLGRTVTGLLRSVLSRTSKDEELYNFARIDDEHDSKPNSLRSNLSGNNLFQRTSLANHNCGENTELQQLSSNGTLTGVKSETDADDGRRLSEGSGQWYNDNQHAETISGLFDDITEDDVKARRNRITEWQAGWNVTNAIQVCLI